MTTNAGGLTIYPGDQTVSVNFTTISGASPTVYSDATCATAVSLPDSISATKTYYVRSAQVVNVSMKVSGTEVATPQGATRQYHFEPGVLNGFGIDPVVDTALDFGPVNAGGGGSSPIVIEGPFHFTFAIPNIDAGTVLLGYTPAVGTIIMGILVDPASTSFDTSLFFGATTAELNAFTSWQCDIADGVPAVAGDPGSASWRRALQGSGTAYQGVQVKTSTPMVIGTATSGTPPVSGDVTFWLVTIPMPT